MAPLKNKILREDVTQELDCWCSCYVNISGCVNLLSKAHQSRSVNVVKLWQGPRVVLTKLVQVINHPTLEKKVKYSHRKETWYFLF